MATANKEKIIQHLQDQRDRAIELGEVASTDRVLGIFLYGSQNYNLANEYSDVDSKLIVLPTFKDFCLTPKMVSKEIGFLGNEHIEIKDIRLYREGLMHQGINYIETLYTDYCIINPNYKELFDYYFLQQRETIAHYNRSKTIAAAGNQILNTLNKNPTDNKTLANANRLALFLRDYIADKPYEDCIRPSGMEWVKLWQLKFGESDFSKDDTAKLSSAKKLYTATKQILNQYQVVDSPDAEAAQQTLDDGIMEILKKSFRNDMGQFNISRRDFFDKLTAIESKALYALMAEVHEEGVVTISRLVEKSGISRLTFDKMLQKLKKYRIAEVQSMGAHGTRVKFIQPEIRAEAIDI